ncbi:MAG: FHA domain-containing protein [Phycisphaera sp.]|nr:FHA domain-containing protein [Phycisphaera sp.]
MGYVVRVISGPSSGASVPLGDGPLLIGAGERAQLRLPIEGVSNEHAVIHREGEHWSLENLSARGTSVNQHAVTGKTRIRLRDRIQPCEGTVLVIDQGDKPARKSPLPMVILLLLLLGGAGAAVVWMNQEPTATRPPGDYRQAYHALSRWMGEQAAAGKLPVETAILFEECWRLERAGRHPSAADAYARLDLTLSPMQTSDASGQTRSFVWLKQHYPQALSDLMQSSSTLAPTDAPRTAAAVMQFVQSGIEYNQSKAKP